MLGVLLHTPRGPFYSPKAARSPWSSIWKAILAFCWAAHRTVRCTTGHEQCLSGARSLSLSGEADRWTFGPLGAPDTVRCTPTVRCDQVTVGLATCRPLIALPTVGRGHRWLTGQSGAYRTIQSILAAAPSVNSREQRLRCRASLCTGHCPVHTGQSGAPKAGAVLAGLSQTSLILFHFS
jgi:hypothetical protein